MGRSYGYRRKILFCLYLFSTFFIPVARLCLYSSLSRLVSFYLFASSFFNAALLLSFSRSFFLALPFVLVHQPWSILPSLSFHPRLKMWHSTGLLRCLRWCGIRAGLPRRGVHRGNDAQIGRIISKTTTLCLQPSSYYHSSPLISLSPSFSHSISCLFALSPPYRRSLVPSLSFSCSYSRRRRSPGMEYNPHFRHRRRTTTLPPLPATVPDDE